MPDPAMTILAAAPAAEESLPPEGQALVMVAVLAAIVAAFAGLIAMTVIRIIARRASERNARGTDPSAPAESPWAVAGQRAEPFDSNDIEGGRG